MRVHRAATAPPGSTSGWKRRDRRALSSMRRTASTARPAISRIRIKTFAGWYPRAAAARTTRACSAGRTGAPGGPDDRRRRPSRWAGRGARFNMAEARLHPEARLVCDLIVASGRPPIETQTPAEARVAHLASRKVLQPDAEGVAEVRELAAPGPAGRIPLRLYRGKGCAGDALQPALVYFHGGGWVIGDLESHDQLCRALANAIPSIVVAVDYRLAPEHRFPAAVEDALAATHWLAEHAAGIGIDCGRLAVGGDSAGGNLAAVVALAARDGSDPRIRAQLLIYPGTDMGLEHASHHRHAGQLPLTRAGMGGFV